MLRLSILCSLLLAAGACKKSHTADERGAAPPPIASSQAGACASGGGTVADPVTSTFFPRAAGDYCVDPHGEARAFGKEASGSLDQVCTELFDGECEVYKAYGLERVVTLKYVDGKGSPGTVSVSLSRFATREGAFGFFTKRVVADTDPEEITLTKLDLPGAGALGSGIAYVWRGVHVAELSYTNEVEPPDQLKSTGKRVLPPLATALAVKLPGDTALPVAALALPAADRYPFGLSYAFDDVLGLTGVGAGAVGFYQRDGRRWRAFAIVRPDEDSAKDVVKALRKVEGSKTLKPPPIEGLAFSLRPDDDAPKLSWFATRTGRVVVGIGDEEFAVSDQSEAGPKATNMSDEQKLAELGKLAQSAATVAANANK